MRAPWLCAGLLVFASVAAAAPNAADHDGDGRISREEFLNQAANQAFEADKNEDGLLESNELKLTDEQAQAMDTNGNGAVSVEEYQSALMQGFAALDKNGDGFLEPNEMKAR